MVISNWKIQKQESRAIQVFVSCKESVNRKKPAGGCSRQRERDPCRAHRKQAASLQSGGCELASGAEAVRPTLACSLTVHSSCMSRCFVPCCNFAFILNTKVLPATLCDRSICSRKIAICSCLGLRRHRQRLSRCNSTQANVTTMRSLRPPWQSCDGSWPLRVKPLWVATDMKLGGITAAMSSMALLDAVNTFA